jgi:hypothetical protein
VRLRVDRIWRSRRCADSILCRRWRSIARRAVRSGALRCRGLKWAAGVDMKGWNSNRNALGRERQKLSHVVWQRWRVTACEWPPRRCSA